MAKANVLGFKPVSYPEETRTFTDPEQPGEEFAITLRPLDHFLTAIAIENAREIAKVGVYPMSDGNLIINEDMAKTLCTIEAMQGGPVAERYVWSELAVFFARMPQAATELLEWVGEIAARRADPGNASRADSAS